MFSKNIASESTKYSDRNLELLKQLKESPTDTVEPIEIKEDKPDIHNSNNINKLAKDLHMKYSDLSLIVEIIKSEINPNNSSKHEDKIIIGQL